MRAAESTLPRVTVKAAEEALRALARAYRSYQLYLPNNPMRARSLDDARQLFVELWRHADELSLAITETAFVLEGEVVYRDEERGAAGLPWLLYRDGLRRLDISSGFETAELEAFLELLHRSKTAPPDEDDLVTLLWVADFKQLTYRHVELMVDFDAVYSPDSDVQSDTIDLTRPTSVQFTESVLPGDGPAPGFLAVEEFESSLYFLDAAEVAHLQDELRREYETDGRLAVIAALFDIIEGQSDVAAQLEAANIANQLVVEALAESEYNVAATILREARATLSRRTDLDASVVESVSALATRLSEPEVIAQLLQAVDVGDSPVLGVLDHLFAELRPTAMIPLLTWYGAATPSPARQAIERAIVRIASRHTTELVRLLEHPAPLVVRGAVMVARLVPSAVLVTPLTRLLSSTDAQLRSDAVQALAAIGSPGALKVLENAIDDASRDVRVGALKAIGANRHAAAVPRLQKVLDRKTLRDADLSEKMAFFEAYAAVCGDSGVATLDTMLNGRGLLGFREPPEMRACAAHALGILASQPAIRALQKSADAQDVVVRSAVGRALRGSV